MPRLPVRMSAGVGNVRASIRGRVVRQGAVRGWLSKLTSEQVHRIKKNAGEAMARMGYQLFSELNQEAANVG